MDEGRDEEVNEYTFTFVRFGGVHQLARAECEVKTEGGYYFPLHLSLARICCTGERRTETI